MTALPLLLLALAFVSLGVTLGALLLMLRVGVRQAKLDGQDEQLLQIWRSLLAVNRLNAAFCQAREAMRREAQRYHDNRSETGQRG